jgi:uncharacterized membrane protein YfcA
VLDQLILFVASLAANFFSALSGGGAGLIQFPMLIFLGLPFGWRWRRTRWPVWRWGWARRCGI